MASKKKKEVPSIFGLFDKKRSEEITQMSKGSTSTQKFLNKTLAPSSREQIASNVIKSSNPTTLSYGNNENYVAQRILAPLPSAPTTSIDIFNKLKEENEMKIKQQNQDKKIDWIDSLKDGYNFGDITKTVLGTVGFGEQSSNKEPIEANTKAIEDMYKNYTEEQLKNEQKRIQNKILTYSKNGVKSPKNKDGKYTLSGVLNMASNENAEKLRNDPEYITLLQIDDTLNEMIQNTRIKNKKYDKGFAGFAEKSTDVLVGGMAKGARGIEGTIKKITGKEDTISEKTYMEKYSDKAMSEANGKAEKALLEMQGSIGQMVPQMVVPAGKASTVLGFANYGGSAYNEAKEQGYTEEQATRYGIVNGTLEMALNKVLPSFKVGGKNIYGKTATDNLTKKIMSKTIGNEAFKRWIIDASGEFTEEYLQEFLDPIVREALLEENNGVGIIKGKNASEIASNIANYTAKNFFSKENFHAGLLGALNSGLMGAPSAFQANAYTKATGRSSETGLTQNEQTVIDNIVENRTEELKKSKDKVTKKDISKIEKEVRQDLERGYIETSEIERALSNEEWTKHDKIVKQKESLQKELDELNSRTMDKITPPEYKRISELEEQIKNIDTDTTRGELNSAMQGKLTENDTLLQNIYGKTISRNEKFETTAKASGIDINDETIKTIKDKMFKRGIEISFDESQFKGTNEDAFWRQNEDGTREVIFNPKADTGMLLQNVAVHEMYHDVFGSKTGQKLNKEILDYVKSKDGYEEARKELEQVYAKDYDDTNSEEFTKKIDEEVVAKVLGQKLGDQEYINSLTMEKPNTARAIYNWVVDKLNKFTGSKNEKLFWTDVKNKFEAALSEDYVARENSTESRSSMVGMKNIKKTLKNNNLTVEQRTLLNKIKNNYNNALSQFNGKNNEQIRKNTGWFQDKNGDWKFEITDKYSKLKIVPQKNGEYKLGDLLDHKLLYDIEPRIKNIKVKFKNKNGVNGTYYDLAPIRHITLNNNLIDKGTETLKSTLIHEIQHYNQHRNSFETGIGSGTTLQDMVDYINSLGEIEAKDVQQRINLTQKQLIQSKPESSKNNPVHPRTNELLQQRINELANKQNKKYNRKKGRGSFEEEIVQSIQEGKNENSNVDTRRGIELDNSSFSLKQKQLDIIQKNNPVNDDYHTWIRNIDDIKTLEEALQDEDWADYDEINPDLTKQDLLDAIEKGKIIVYSSYPIEQGIFVSPSQMEAESYSGDGKIYSKEVNINDVAWIDPTQGQYAKINDTRKSTKTDNFQEFLDKNIQRGKGKTMQEVKTQQEVEKIVAPIQEENKVLKQEVETLKKEVRDIQENNTISYEEFEEQNKRIAPLLEEQEAPPEVEQVYDNLKDTTRMPKKEVKLLSKNIKDTLGLTNKQKLDLEEIIQDYSTSETATREDLYNDIKQRYGKQAIITEYEDIRNVQTKVKSMKLDVSDNIKHDIADYNMLKQKNFGKLSFSRNGQPVDSVYQELSSEYPNYFPSNIYNETDQFLKIVDVANLENKSVEELNLDDNYIKETSDYIYESILDSKQDALQKEVEKNAKKSMQGELKAPLPTVLDTSSIDANNVVDEVRLMEHKARKKSQADKGNGKRAPFDWAAFEEVGRRIRAGEDANSIAELNKLDAERENQQTEEQKKLKPKNESTLKKSLTYGQYLFTNRNVEIDNYAKETGNHNIQVLADHINNIQGEITTNINNSQTDNNGNTIGKSITNIFSQADKAGLSEAFNDYLFHLSNIERHKWGKGSQVPGIDSSILIEEYEKTYPEMKKWAKEVNKYNKNLLYKQADAGLITKELADSLSEMYEFYVPFMENLEGEYTPDKTNSIKTRSTVKRAKGGSSRNLLGFEEAMIKQTESAITQIRKNQLYQEIVKTKENASVDFENNTNPDIQDNGLFSDNGKYYLTAYVDGKATQVEIDKSLYHGLAQEGNKKIRQAEQKLSPITKPLQATSNIRRNILTTWNPSFMVTNMLKDIQDAPLNSKYANDMIKNYPRALKEISTGKGKHLEAFLNMYGQANLRGDYNLDSGLSDITKLAENSKSSKGMKFSKDLLKKIPQINEMIEMAPRYAEYLASIENGCSQMEALYNAREVTTNFGRGGIVTKALNRNGFTFLNASVQGMSKLVRNFSGENGGRAVMGCIAKATALGIAPALLNALLFGDDDDYEVLPDYIKDNYYLIKVDEWDDKYDKTGNIVKGGGSAFIRIPKGRMMSIFGSAARRTLEGIQGRENPYEGYLSNAYNQVGIQNPSESNIFAPLIQAKNNKTWYGTDLVPKRLQTNKEDGTKIPAKDQYDASTDKMSIWLGEKLNISPYKINYVIDQYSGGIGDIILPMMTEEAQNGSDSTTGKMIAPLKDKFTADSITDNKYVTNFYSKLEELGEKKNATESKKDEMSYNYMRNISFEMGSLYAEMRKVQADTTLKDSKKYAKVQNIKAEINRLAEEGMKGYKDVETYDNYARVGDRELYKYQSKDGKTGWSDSNGQYAADINNLGLSIKEKNEYYTTKMKMSDIWNKYEDYNTSKSLAIKAIKKSKMSDEAKYNLYNASYNKNNKLNIAQEIGISADEFLDYASQTFKADKDKNGKSISGSKKSKVVNYINSMKISKPQKAIMLKLEYNTINDYNDTIINYLNNNSLTYDEEEYILKKLGFEVSKDGTIKWD